MSANFNPMDKLRKCLMYLYNQDITNVNNAISYFEDNDKIFQMKDIKIRILKGGSYKIKNYYLENNQLKDIRGASVLLTYVEETIIPKLIDKYFNQDSIIYNGGGNIFAILPNDIYEEKFNSSDNTFGLILEREAEKYLISANIAYYVSEPMNLSAILGKNYKMEMVKVENLLDSRKKTKLSINNIPTSELINQSIEMVENNKFYNIEISAKTLDFPALCNNCRTKLAKYYTYNQGNEKSSICASCLHKMLVGKTAKVSKYHEQYKKIVNLNPQSKKIDILTPENIQSLEDIDENDIAVVYGDGNNMGGIIQQFTKITQMMEFSELVKEASNQAVFCAMKDNHITKFEVVGLGGDDVFVIVSGKQAIEFSISLIEKYNNIFSKKYPENPSTMSIGIAIGKTHTPIRILLQKAEEQLNIAKELSKTKLTVQEKNQLELLGYETKEDVDDGSLSFTILKDYDSSTYSKEIVNEENQKIDVINTLLPYELSTAKDIIQLAAKFKYNKTSKTRLYNLSNAFKNVESISEGNLFFNYMNVKDTNNRIHLNDISNWNRNDCYFYKRIVDKETYIAYIWDDLLNIIDYTKNINQNGVDAFE